MLLKGKQIAVLAENFYEDLEIWYPLLRMKEEGADVKVIGSGSATSYNSKHGYPVNVDAAVDAVQVRDFDAVIVPGGWSPDLMRRYPAMVKFVADAHNNGTVVAAICHAGWLLVSAGILKGKTVTSFYSIKDDVINAGANWVDQEVVCDGNLITSRTPKDLPAFCQAIIAAVAAR